MYCYLTTETNKEPFCIDQNTQKEIDTNWNLFTERRPTKENATLCRLVKIEEDKIIIATDVTYKDVVGLRWRNLISHDRDLFQVVTALAIVKTSDGFTVLIPRDSGDWEPSIECPGGFIRSTYLNDRKISVAGFIKQRVCKDLNIDTEQIQSCDYLIVYDAKEILEYMLVYEITLTLTKSELGTQHPTFVIVPPEYTPDNHDTFTDQHLHIPSANAMKEATYVLDCVTQVR